MGDATRPLLGTGDATSIVAWYRGDPISRERFVGEISALAERVPPRRFAINLCEDRFHFAVAFCAALLRGQVSLLPHNRSLGGVAEVAARYPGHYFLDDGGFRAGRPADMPALRTGEWVDCGVSDDSVVTSSGGVPHIPADRTAAIVFTSGSTGRPRAHAKSWDSLTTAARLQYEYLRHMHAELSCVLATVPPQHMYGLDASVMLPLQSGLPLRDDRPLFPDDVRRALTACGAAPLLVTTPIHLRVLTRSELSYPNCGLVLSATAPLDRDVAALAEHRFGCEVHEIYGSTETGAMANRRTVAGERWKPNRGIRVECDGTGTARAFADHLPGSIPMMDRIELAQDGSFELFGRLDDALNIAGKHAALSDLNRCLLAIPGVDDGAIFLLDTPPGDPPRLGAMVVASGLDAATISTALRKFADPVFLPRRIVFVDEMPRNDTGKLSRHALQSNWGQQGIGSNLIEP